MRSAAPIKPWCSGYLRRALPLARRVLRKCRYRFELRIPLRSLVPGDDAMAEVAQVAELHLRQPRFAPEAPKIRREALLGKHQTACSANSTLRSRTRKSK